MIQRDRTFSLVIEGEIPGELRYPQLKRATTLPAPTIIMSRAGGRLIILPIIPYHPTPGMARESIIIMDMRHMYNRAILH